MKMKILTFGIEEWYLEKCCTTADFSDTSSLTRPKEYPISLTSILAGWPSHHRAL